MNEENSCPRQILQRIAEIWRVDSSRIRWGEATEEHADFDWWPGDFKVHVGARTQRAGENELIGSSKEPAGETEVKVVISTKVLRDVATDSDHFAEMAAVLLHWSTSTYALVYLPKRVGSGDRVSLWFSSSGYISRDNMGWMLDLLANTGVVQATNAQIYAPSFPETLGTGTPDTSRPDELKDANLDWILGVLDQGFAPLGKQPSRWIGTGEFEEFAEKWAQSDRCFGFGDSSGMTLETPFGQTSALIRLQTAQKHPQLGHGLLSTLQLHHSDDLYGISRRAAELNMAEWLSWTGFPQIGCWHPDPNEGKMLAFTSFLPNALYRLGLATQIAFWMMERTYWLRNLWYPNMKDATMLEILNKRLSAEEGSS